MKVRIIITGGTFDKEYDEIGGRLTFRKTHLKTILKQARCRVPVSLEVNKLIDSLEMKEKYRRSILNSCKKSKEKKILITHGTDRMIETAIVLGKANLGKTIVLTGAMIPYSVIDSDAMFNLGCGITAVQMLPPGVYIAMNGKIFDWNNVRKNTRIGIFETLRAD